MCVCVCVCVCVQNAFQEQNKSVVISTGKPEHRNPVLLAKYPMIRGWAGKALFGQRLICLWCVCVQNAFQERNENVIINTVKRLPLHVIPPLIKEVSQRMHGHPQR